MVLVLSSAYTLFVNVNVNNFIKEGRSYYEQVSRVSPKNFGTFFK